MTMTGGGVHDGGAANIYHNHIYDPGLRPRGRPPPNGLGPSRSRAPHHTSTHTPHSQKGAGPTPTHRGRGEPYLLRGRGGWACRAGSYIYIYICYIFELGTSSLRLLFCCWTLQAKSKCAATRPPKCMHFFFPESSKCLASATTFGVCAPLRSTSVSATFLKRQPRQIRST